MALLKALGTHCRKLRVQQGYSIDRMAKEGDQLSPSVIHRLEQGSGAVTVSALFRYAQVLNVPATQLLDFEMPSESALSAKLSVLSVDHASVAKLAFKTLLPLYSLKAVAGYFGQSEAVEPEGWIDAKKFGKLDKSMFVARATGDSMTPKIRDGDYLVFRRDPLGTRQGKIVLAQYRGPADPETGGSYTVKVYTSTKIVDAKESTWRHRQITLSPLNPAYDPILLSPSDEEDFRIVAEYLSTL